MKHYALELARETLKGRILGQRTSYQESTEQASYGAVSKMGYTQMSMLL